MKTEQFCSLSAHQTHARVPVCARPAGSTFTTPLSRACSLVRELTSCVGRAVREEVGVLLEHIGSMHFLSGKGQESFLEKEFSKRKPEG